MADAFIEIEGISGESIRDGFEDQIPILSFDAGVQQLSAMGTGTSGSGVSNASVTPLSFTKLTDSASGPLFQACCQGSRIPTAKITLNKAKDGEPLAYLVVELEDVYIDNFQMGGSAEGIPTENVSMTYGKITFTYTPDSDSAEPVVGTWSPAVTA